LITLWKVKEDTYIEVLKNNLEEKIVYHHTVSKAMHASSHRNVLSTEILFRFSVTQAGTSSAKLAHRLGFMQETNSI